MPYSPPFDDFLFAEKMSPVETGSYLAQCLTVPRRALPDELIEYVHRISAGIPKYIHLTANQLVTEQAIVIEEACRLPVVRGIPDLERTNSVEESVDEEADRTFMSKSTSQEQQQKEETVVNGISKEDRKEGFELHAQLLTGRVSIPENATTSDDDSERGENPEMERLHGGRSNYITVYKFKQHMQLDITAPKREPSTRRFSSVSGDPDQDKPPEPKFVVDELRVSQMFKVNPSEELELVGGFYMKKRRSQEKQKPDDNNVDGRESDNNSEGRKEVVSEIIKLDSVWESPRVEDHHRSSLPSLRKPCLPPMPDFLKAGQPSESVPGLELPTTLTPESRKALSPSRDISRSFSRFKAPSELRPIQVRVVRDLNKVPFVPELVSCIVIVTQFSFLFVAACSSDVFDGGLGT